MANQEFGVKGLDSQAQPRPSSGERGQMVRSQTFGIGLKGHLGPDFEPRLYGGQESFELARFQKGGGSAPDVHGGPPGIRGGRSVEFSKDALEPRGDKVGARLTIEPTPRALRSAKRNVKVKTEICHGELQPAKLQGRPIFQERGCLNG